VVVGAADQQDDTLATANKALATPNTATAMTMVMVMMAACGGVCCRRS
jgi:hypothetical protein